MLSISINLFGQGIVSLGEDNTVSLRTGKYKLNFHDINVHKTVNPISLEEGNFDLALNDVGLSRVHLLHTEVGVYSIEGSELFLAQDNTLGIEAANFEVNTSSLDFHLEGHTQVGLDTLEYSIHLPDLVFNKRYKVEVETLSSVFEFNDINFDITTRDMEVTGFDNSITVLSTRMVENGSVVSYNNNITFLSETGEVSGDNNSITVLSTRFIENGDVTSTSNTLEMT